MLHPVDDKQMGCEEGQSEVFQIDLFLVVGSEEMVYSDSAAEEKPIVNNNNIFVL